MALREHVKRRRCSTSASSSSSDDLGNGSIASEESTLPFIEIKRIPKRKKPTGLGMGEETDNFDYTIA